MKHCLRQPLYALGMMWLLGCAGGGSEIPNIKLVPSSGALVFENGSPADSAWVFFISTSYVPVPGLGDSLALFDSVMTDPEGKYTYLLMEGETVNILASKGGLYSYRAGVVGTAEPFTIPTTTLRSPGSLSGAVRVHPDSVVEDVVVAAIGTNRYATADDSGYFSLSSMAPGSYRLAVYALPPLILGPPTRHMPPSIDTSATIRPDVDGMWSDTLKVGW